MRGVSGLSPVESAVFRRYRSRQVPHPGPLPGGEGGRGTTAGRFAIATLVVVVLFATAPAFGDGPKPVSFELDVKPILREHCVRCHGDDVHKSDLNLQSYGSTLKGGSGGEVVVAGRLGGSSLYQAIAREGDAAPMPPNRPKIPEDQVAVVRRWISEGLRETADGAPAMSRRGLDFQAPTPGLETGPGAMPSGWPTLDLPETRRPHPVTALATSPRAPLVAVAGHERIWLVHSETREPLGALAFPEGVPFVLRFSRDGQVLMAAGGRPVRSGKVVLFDVKSGRRLAEIGDELDSILAADLSPDQKLVALGGTGKVVKVYATADGRLAYAIAKPTDWVTALQFSPDGSKLATADRSGAVHLWESSTGGILLSLSEHKDAVTALDWRGDGLALATGGEDGKLILWDAQGGWPSTTLDAPHTPKATAKARGKRPGGVLSVKFAIDGRFVTSGRDKMVRFWDTSGQPIAAFETPTALPLKVAVTADGQTIVAGDAEGKLHFWAVPVRKE